MKMNASLSEPIKSSVSVTNSMSPILADTWYAFHHRDVCEPFEALLEKNFPDWLNFLAKRIGAIHGSLFFFLARKHSAIMTSTTVPGAKAFFFLEALFGASQKHIILLEFLESKKANAHSVLRRIRYYVWLHWILKPVLRRSLLTAHVLAQGDRSEYSRLFGIAEEHFVFIPWPKRERQDSYIEARVSSDRWIVSSGREACDWDTLFKAAEGQNWRLKIVCSRRDLPRVRRLNKNGIAEVLYEISRQEHENELKNASVYVLCLSEQERSSGHVRISDATKAATPIVATAVKGIEGYIDDRKTGLLVPPGDAIALRAAVNRLLADISYSRMLARNAFDQAANHTREHYMEKIGVLIRSAVEQNTAFR
jgi:glycosyltransferase involved in cell wall biosynthesis